MSNKAVLCEEIEVVSLSVRDSIRKR